MSPLNSGRTPKMKPVAPKRTALIAAVDVGTDKIACLIARLKPRGPQQVLRRGSPAIDVIGLRPTEARGMKAGTVVALGLAEEAVRYAVHLAERSAKCQVESVIISMSSGRIASEHLTSTIDLPGGHIADKDISRLLAAGGRQSARDGRVVLHSLPIGYSLDAVRGVRDPRGMLASRFGVDMHVVSADMAPVRNLMLAVERCHLVIEALVAG